jgi:hypothetical protein
MGQLFAPTRPNIADDPATSSPSYCAALSLSWPIGCYSSASVPPSMEMMVQVLSENQGRTIFFGVPLKVPL